VRKKRKPHERKKRKQQEREKKKQQERKKRNRQVRKNRSPARRTEKEKLLVYSNFLAGYGVTVVGQEGR